MTAKKRIIKVEECCPRCQSIGAAVVGLSKAVDVKPKHYAPGLFVLGIVLVGILVGYVSEEIISRAIGLGERYAHWIGIALALGVVGSLLKGVPLRMLVCKRCGRVIELGLGRALPLSWLERVEPDWNCSKCGYCLIGVKEDARCPECGHPFPEQWLHATGAGDPNIDVELQVVTFVDKWKAEHHGVGPWKRRGDGEE